MSLAGQRVDPGRYQVIPRALIFAVREGRVLLQRIPPGRGAWAGRWNGVGGHLTQGESPEQAARREFSEETGLTLEAVRFAGLLLVDVGSSPGIGILVFVGEAGEGDPRAGREGELAWFAPEAAEPTETVNDLPSLLPRTLAVLEGAAPFTALKTFGPDGSGSVRFD